MTKKRKNKEVGITKKNTVGSAKEINTILERGVGGEAVKEIQKLLNKLGYYVNESGIYSLDTENRIKQFQEEAGLEVTGKVDKRTRTAMKNWKPPNKEFKFEYTEPIGYGYEGQVVREIQTALRKHKYPLAVDGSFGPRTKRVVARYKGSIGLKADGIVDEETWNKLGI